MNKPATYRIVRFYQRDLEARTIKRGLTLEGAQAHCQDPETSSATATLPERVKHTERYGPWFDGYTREESE